MRIKNLSIFQFRNIIHQNIKFDSNLSIFLGDNGQGKTNFVESIYFLSKGKSFRTSDTYPLVFNQAEKKAVRVLVEIEKEETLHRIETQILDDKKTFYLNEKRNNSLKIFKNFPVILFSPESLSIIKEGPEYRRSMFDEILLLKDDENIGIIEGFRKSLKSRNALLRRYKQGAMGQNQLQDVLEPLNAIYAGYSKELISRRLQLIEEISDEYDQIVQEITNQNVNTFVDYVDEKGIKIRTPTDDNTVLNKLKERFDLEMKLGTTLVGPHKHDMSFHFDGKESRFFCSQGQQRALILALKLTQILYHHRIYGYYPILILDDVLSELDKDKRAYLIRFLSKNNAQTFLTSTDMEQHQELHNLDLMQFIVRNGTVIKG